MQKRNVMAALFTLIMPLLGLAQTYPTKPIRVVIGGSPGSNAGIFFRLVAPRIGSVLGQQLVADYRPGAGGAIGANLTVKSAPALQASNGADPVGSTPEQRDAYLKSEVAQWLKAGKATRIQWE